MKHEWRPISEAPRDGTWIAVRHTEWGRAHVVRWNIDDRPGREYFVPVERGSPSFVVHAEGLGSDRWLYAPLPPCSTKAGEP